ncbi:hypothetical protein [Prosthecobacter sp.]|uniref:hypothetical protein n=1 Tax=Prosthecobacter sp. TaxID=1965333 RepID=UPI002AB8BCD9|nr:hypothetical protein [Prosthecobacter sp.]MDZ4402098.1 hypothetical protein [Prosthecobacter sp.]
MRTDLQHDLQRLRELAFHLHEKSVDLLKRFQQSKKEINSNPLSEQIWKVYDWLLVPYSLWPLDFQGMAEHLLKLIKLKKEFDRPLNLLLEIISPPPSRLATAEIEKFEHLMQSGKYDRLTKQPAKFSEVEAALSEDADFDNSWRLIKSHFDHSKLANRSGVIRRRLSQERNFRQGWEFSWATKKQRFLALFDAMCHRWKLYGIQKDRPLLLKVSINPTPYGTMIVIPGHWSLDNKRDLDWAAIKRIHRVHGAMNQGPKLSAARTERIQEAQKVKALWEAAKKQNLRGDKRVEHVLTAMKKDPRTDPSWVKRHLRLAKSSDQNRR